MSQLPRLLFARLQSIVDTLRESYWFLPGLIAIGSGAAALGMVRLDRNLSDSAIEWIPWIANTEPDGARAVLSVVAGSMITVTGVVFSITIVALTLASSQFGPRLLRNFLRDRSNQLAFGTFVATFLYSLIVLRAVKGNDVPEISTIVAVVLSAASLFVLIFFIHHTARSIEASSVIAGVAHEIEKHIPKLFPERIGEEEPSLASIDEALERLSSDGVNVTASASGFIRLVDQEALLRLAVEHDLLVTLHHEPGDFVSEGISLARVGPSEGLGEDTLRALRNSVVIGDYRTPIQDLRFLINQLTEIAVRALSPGVNDPRTAIDCVHRLGAIVCAVADREMPSAGRLDEHGTLRVVAPRSTFEAITASCFEPIRRYGASHVSIVVTVLEALGSASECCPDPRRRRVLSVHATEMFQAFSAEKPQSSRDLAAVQNVLDRTTRRLA